MEMPARTVYSSGYLRYFVSLFRIEFKDRPLPVLKARRKKSMVRVLNRISDA
jgi:hypothetical protein